MPIGRELTGSFHFLVVLLVLFSPWNAGADDETSQQIRRAYVPADNPDAWPQGEWKALPVDAFRQLSDDLGVDNANPPRAMLQHVTYSATWSETSSLKGEFVAETGLRGIQADYLSLGQPTLSLTGLSWVDRPAIWGTDPDGHALLRVESADEQLVGHWSLRGHEGLGDYEFHAELLPAVLSRFELRLPAEKHLEVNTGLVAVSIPDPDPEWRRWRVDLGREITLHLVISDESPEPSTSDLIVQRTSQFRTLPDGLRFRTSFTVNHLRGPIRELSFSVPREMQVSTITLGSELDLPFRTERDEDRVRVVVPLSSITLVPHTIVTLQGVMPLTAEKKWNLPRISLRQAHLWESRLSISVPRPLVLSNFSLTNCRLISSTMNRNQTDSLELEDWSDTSSVSITIDTPQSDIVCDVLTALSCESSQTTSRTLLKLSTRAGSLYQLPCLIRNGWQVTRVTSVPWRRPNAIAQWKTTVCDDGTSQLQLEFRDALIPEQAIIVEIWARRISDPSSNSLELPVARPSDSQPRSVAIAVQTALGQGIELPPDSTYQERTFAEATATWSNDLEGTTWLTQLTGDDGVLVAPVTYYSEKPSLTDHLLLSPSILTTDISSSDRNSSIEKTPSLSPSKLHEAPQHSGDPSSPVPLLAQLTVESYAPNASEESCVHVVNYVLTPAVAGRTLHFTLLEPATFIAVRGGRMSKATVLNDQSAQVHLPDDIDRYDIQLEYRTPFIQSLLTGETDVPLPQSEIIASSIQWQLHLPPSYRLSPETSGTSTGRPHVNWTQRLIGPFGRSDVHSSNNPVIEPEPREALVVSSNATDSIIDEGEYSDPGQRYTRSVSFSEPTLHLSIWKDDVSKRLGWMLFVASCATIGLLRLTYSTRNLWIVSFLTLAAAIMAAVVSDSYAIPCGGLLLGLITGMLLPQELWQRPQTAISSRSGSTGRWPALFGATLSLLVLELHLVSRVEAFQQLSVPPTLSPITNDDRPPDERSFNVDVLIPIKSGQPTLDDTPVVYVTSELLKRWDRYGESQHNSPRYLIREAKYGITFDQRPFPRMQAVFDVVLLDLATSQIRLPLDDIAIDGENACRVNGQAATIIPLRSNLGVSVDISALSPAPLPLNDDIDTPPETRASAGSDRPSVLRVELQCHLRTLETAALPPVNIPVPRVLSSIAHLTLKTASFQEPSVDRFGSTTIDRDSQRLVIELGPVQRLQINWPDGDSRTGSFVPDSAVSSVIVHPQRLRVESRLVFVSRPKMSSPDRFLEIQLPPGSHVNDVQATHLARWEERSRPGEPVALGVTFQESLPDGAVSIHIDYDVLVAREGASMTLPAIRLVPSHQSDYFTDHALALTAAPGFRIDYVPAPDQHDQVSRMSLEQFKQEWGSVESFDPDLAFSLKSPVPLDVAASEVIPNSDATIAEQITVENTRLKWLVDINLNSISTAMAIHEISIDPRLQVTAVAVTQNGTNRLARWNRNAEDRITILLDEVVIGTQQIVISGHFPFELQQRFAIPRISISGSSISEHLLTISSEQDWMIEAFDSNDHPIPDGDTPTNTEGESTAGRRWSFDRLADTSPSSIRVQEAVTSMGYDRIIAVDAVGDQLWRITTQILLANDVPLPPQLVVDLPEVISESNRLEMSFHTDQQRINQNGHLILTIPTATPALASRRLKLTATVNASETEAQQVPLVALSNGDIRKDWLVLGPDLPFTFDHGRRIQEISEVDREAIGLPELADESTFRIYEPDADNWTLAPNSSASVGGIVRKIETAIWDNDAMYFSGVTSLQVSVRLLDELTISLAPKTVINQTDWAFGTIQTTRTEDATIAVVPLNSTEIEREQPVWLTIWWNLPRDGVGLQHKLQMPTTQDVPVLEQTMAFFGSDLSRYEITGNVAPLDSDAVIGQLQDDPRADHRVISQALHAAGFGEHLSRADTVHVVKQNDPATQEAPTLITIWILNRQLRRILLVILISIALFFTGWKTRSHIHLQRLLENINRSSFAGPTLLAAMIWTAGPSTLGFYAMFLLSMVWALQIWKSHQTSTGPYYSTPTPD